MHTNLGRAPLSPVAVEALILAAGYVDVELDLDTGAQQAWPGHASRAWRPVRPPKTLAVNNGAAALVLATHDPGGGPRVVVSRGELIEIGAGFACRT